MLVDFLNTKEKYNLEFKMEVTKTFLKTVSAYANYNGGVIMFGVDDDGDRKSTRLNSSHL